MKKLFAIIMLGAMIISLAACTGAEFTDNKSAPTTSLNSSISQSQSVVSAVSIIETASSSSFSDVSSSIRLAYYDDIADIHGSDTFSFGELGGIDKDGEVWCATPGGGPNHYANPVIADETFLYIRVIWESDGHFQWYRIRISNLDETVVLPDSEGKMFVGTDGILLLCDDGTFFDVERWKWNA